MRGIRFTGYFCPGIIEVSKTAQIPDDFYGCMGVPITALGKISWGEGKQFDILDMIRPVLNGKVLYCRYVIRRRLPEEIQRYMDEGRPFVQYGEDLIIPLDEGEKDDE